MKASVNFYWESFILNKDASSLSQDMTVLIVRVYLLFGGDFEGSSVGDVSKWDTCSFSFLHKSFPEYEYECKYKDDSNNIRLNT